MLAQALLPGLFGSPLGPAESFWGGRFFGEGAPYFLSLYVGPPWSLALRGASAAARPALGGAAALVLARRAGRARGARLALGTRRGQALLLPHLALAIAAGFAVDRLLAGRDWRGLAAAAGAMAALAVAHRGGAVAVACRAQAWTGVAEPAWPQLLDVARREAGLALLLALGARGRGVGGRARCARSVARGRARGRALPWRTSRGPEPA